MSYGTVKTQFMGILNRRDITASLVETFMSLAVQRIQRELRIPPMEKVVELTTDGTAKLSVPGDLLEFISVHTNDDTHHDKLTRTDLQTILVESRNSGIPKFYHREGAYIYLGPYPATGTSVYVHYHSDSTVLSSDADTNWMTEVAPALLIYAALSYAADYFLDDRKMLFEQTYSSTKDALNIQAQQDEVQNASIRSAWSID